MWWGLLVNTLPSVAWACSIDPDTPVYSIGASSVSSMSRSSDAELSPIESQYLSVPSNDSARASLQYITARPHVAGTPGDLAMAHYVQQRLLDAGIPKAVIDPQRTLLAYPVDRSLQLVDVAGQVVFKASLAEDILKIDPTSDTWWRNHTFNGYSPSGNASGRLVYANYGLPEDFAALEKAGVSVKGAIALMRYGKCFRGLKVKNAQDAGATAALIYSDPADDGYAQGSVYPYGPWRPNSSVQRGSIQFISTCAGDPARAYAPHGRNVSEVCGYTQEELIPQIPVLPISYADVLPFLENLGGPEAPSSFRGALNLTYRMGPTREGLRTELSVHNHFRKSPVWNVIATIPGSLPTEKDQPVLLGNHRDAWVYGAADPNSGTAQLLEVARGLGSLLKTGWRPLRSIILCSWSGEEYGLLGSTAWAEVNGDSAATGGVDDKGLLSRALAYLNVDVGVSGPTFGAAGTPTLGKVLAGVLGQVRDPQSKRPLSEHWGDGDLSALGSGSDYTAFIDHLGIPSLDMSFRPKTMTYGVYHSVYDSFNWMETEGDPGFHYHTAMAQIWGLVALRLAGQQELPKAVLPLNATLQAEAIKGYIADAKTEVHSAGVPQLDFGKIEEAQSAFASAARTAMSERESAADDFNRRMGMLERHFLTEAGLPGRKWFRHVLQAPGLYTGYAAKTLPGVNDAVLRQDWKGAQAQLNVAAESIQAAAKFLAGIDSESEYTLVV